MIYSDKQKIIRDRSLPKAVRDVVKMYPTNQANRQYYGGLPHLGNALWGSWQSRHIQNAADAYENYSLSDNLLIKGFEKPRVSKIRLGGGSPARFKPYVKCIESIKKSLSSRILSDYPLAAGDEKDKEPIIEYLNTNCNVTLDKGNLIFTHSSTQGFSLIMEAILDYGDVVLMTAPNYGLFSFIPERVGGRVKLLELQPSEGWKINPQTLRKRIDKINKDLRTDYDRNRGKYIFRQSDKSPKVGAFLHINPHNPTGIVYGKKERELLSEIAMVCRSAGVFVIDDLAYTGLEFDRDNTAVPIASLPKHFNNTISLYTLSKSYGLAGIRSGLIVANEVVVSLIRDRIFQMSDSLSVTQSSAMSAIFSTDVKDVERKEKYLEHISKEYRRRYIFVKAMVEGLESLNKEESNSFNNIIKDANIPSSQLKYFDGINSISIILEPESGFFVLLDLSQILGKSYKGFRVVDDETLLQFLYTASNIKLLTGKAFCWTSQQSLIVRVTTALNYDELFLSFLRLKKTIDLLD